MILSGERMPGMEDGPDPDFTVAVIDAALRRVPQTCRSEPADLAAAHSSGLPPNKARHGRRPESDSGPRFPPPGAAGGARLIHVFPSTTSRSCLASGAPARRLAPSKSSRVVTTWPRHGRCVRYASWTR